MAIHRIRLGPFQPIYHPTVVEYTLRIPTPNTGSEMLDDGVYYLYDVEDTVLKSVQTRLSTGLFAWGEKVKLEFIEQETATVSNEPSDPAAPFPSDTTGINLQFDK